MTSKRRCKTCGLSRKDTSYSTDGAVICNFCKRVKRKAAARKMHLGKTYGITPEEYAKLLEYNDGACWICEGKRPYNLPVDHDHAIGSGREAVRGICCKRCNGLLADVHDDPSILNNAIFYLEYCHQQAQRILAG